MSECKKFKMDDSFSDFMDVQKALKEHYEEQTLKILVCGKTGCGKSSLLNTLLGCKLFKVGGPGDFDDSESAFEPVTQTVTSVCTKVQDVLLEVFDSPGLQDGTENDHEYLEDMYTKCKDAGLILYCVDMTTTRWTLQEVKATKLLTEKFGVDFWKKCIIVLTKANMVKPQNADTDDKTHSKRAYDNFARKIQKQLTSQGVSIDVAADIPIVAAGSEGDRHLPYVSKIISENSDNRCQDFLPELWVTCFERTSGRSRFNFLKVTAFSKRIKVNKDRLPRAQKELLEELERQYKEKEEMLKQTEARLNEKISQLTIEKQQEIEKIRKSIQDRFPENDKSMVVRQPPIEATDNVLEKMLAGATAGAAIGSFFGPVGTQIGAAVGAVASACSVM